MSDRIFKHGLIQVYTGNGKGKTTAALGLAIRALGHGAKVHIIFFMKGNFPYGEREILSKLPDLSFQVFGHEHLIDPNNVKDEEKQQAHEALEASKLAIQSSKYDLIILDEINVASAWKLISVEDVINSISNKPPKVELVLTGRYADQRIIEKADLVTSMDEIKHPYRRGIEARKGIEY
ncbi:MAG: cob(I)yrinic acid a,c-diamide adenosyltransferase [Dehalococcoidia bacterium]|jgi:cob(I)alamin adenosyltransferase